MNRRRVIKASALAPLTALAMNVQAGVAKVLRPEATPTTTNEPNESIPEGTLLIGIDTRGGSIGIGLTAEMLAESPVVNGVPVVVVQAFHDIADMYFNPEN